MSSTVFPTLDHQDHVEWGGQTASPPQKDCMALKNVNFHQVAH